MLTPALADAAMTPLDTLFRHYFSLMPATPLSLFDISLMLLPMIFSMSLR
jgi:hypothetical protein